MVCSVLFVDKDAIQSDENTKTARDRKRKERKRGKLDIRYRSFIRSDPPFTSPTRLYLFSIAF